MRDDAVSSVVGALLITVVLLGFFAILQADFVPVWEAEAENNHYRIAENDMSRLGQELLTGDAGLRSSVLSMNPEESVPFGPVRFGGTLSIQDAPDGLSLTSPVFTLVTEDSTAQQQALPESLDWTPVEGSETVGGVDSLEELRIRLTNLQPTHADTEFLISITDGLGNPAATLAGKVQPSASVITIRIESRDGNGDRIGQREDTVFPDPLGSNEYYLNILDSDFRVGPAISVSPRPLDINILYEGNGITQGLADPLGPPAMEYAITYTTGGGVTNSGGGTEVTDYTFAGQASRFLYDYPTMYAVDRDLTLEYGALILTQPEGSVVKSTPGFLLAISGDSLLLSIDMAEVSSTSSISRDSGTAIVTMNPLQVNSMVGSASQLSLRLATEHGTAWEDHINWQLRMMGLTGDAGISASSTATDATLSFDASATTAFSDMVINISNPSYEVLIQ